METLDGRMELILKHVERALDGVKADGNRSPVTVAVVEELAKTAREATAAFLAAAPALRRELIVALAQAADSASVAAQADLDLRTDARALVDTAHKAVCSLVDAP